MNAAPQAGAVSVQPSGPITAAFFYPWFANAWDQGVFPFTNFNPSLGWYDSADPETIDKQLDLASQAGLDAFIASWWGPGHHTDQAMPVLLDRTVRAGSPAPDLRWAVYYEEEGQSDPSAASIVDDLRYLESQYFNHPGYLRVDGKPVIFVWADGSDGASMADRWAQAKSSFGGDVYVVLKVFSGYRSAGSQPDSWHQYGPALAYDEQLPFSATVSPGFWLKGQNQRLGRDLDRFRADAQRAKDSGAFWQLITSWNEWGEGTSVEPAAEFGTDYIDALGSVFGGDTGPGVLTVASTTTTTPPADETTTTEGSVTTQASTTTTDGSSTTTGGQTTLGEPAPADSGSPDITVSVTADTDARARYDRRRRSDGRYRIELDASPRIDGLVRFTLPEGIRPTTAILRTYVMRGNSDGFDVHTLVDNPWLESSPIVGTPTFGGRIASSGAIESGSWVDLDVSAALSSDRQVTFGLRTDSPRRIRLKGTRSDKPPELILTGQPEDTTPDEEPPVELTTTTGNDGSVVVGGSTTTTTTTPTTTGSTVSVTVGSTTTTATSEPTTSSTSPSTTSSTSTSTTSTSAPPPVPPGGTVTFGAAGDFGGNPSRAGTVMNDIKPRNLAAFFLLGDMSYDEITPERAWCDWVHGYLGNNYPFEIVAGNHEEDSRVDGYILDFADCMPDRLQSEMGPGGYALNYSTDLGPVTVLSVSPDLVVNGVDYTYDSGSAERAWMLGAIDRAKAEGDWVIVGMHKNCITIGQKSCEIGADFLQTLVDRDVDLVLQGHEHSYQRSHSLSRIVRGGVGTIADNGSDGHYVKGKGTVIVITSAAGRSMRDCSHNDSEFGNFAMHWCAEEATDTKGYLLLTASGSRLSAEFVTTAGARLTDSFSID